MLLCAVHLGQLLSLMLLEMVITAFVSCWTIVIIFIKRERLMRHRWHSWFICAEVLGYKCEAIRSLQLGLDAFLTNTGSVVEAA